MKPIISYSGGKSRQAEWISNHFASHDMYIEPFFGMGSVFFHKPPSKCEIINDLESIIFNFWTVIKNKASSKRLSNLLMITPLCEDILEHYRKTPDDPVEQALAFLVHQKIGFEGGLAAQTNTAYMPKRSSDIRNFSRLGGKIKHFCERLRKAYISNRCALKLIKRYCMDESALIYLDPPYVDKGQYYNTSCNHEEMLYIITQAKCKIVLSGYASDLYESKLKGWRHETSETTTRMHTARIEHIWLNY